jgi:hypothetical protein
MGIGRSPREIGIPIGGRAGEVGEVIEPNGRIASAIPGGVVFFDGVDCVGTREIRVGLPARWIGDYQENHRNPRRQRECESGKPSRT